jgi:hypothetical protein
METRETESLFALLQHDRYTPAELARVLMIDINVIRDAVFAHELPARLAGHDIVCIDRRDVITWLKEQDDHHLAPGRRWS